MKSVTSGDQFVDIGTAASYSVGTFLSCMDLYIQADINSLFCIQDLNFFENAF